MLEGVRLGWVGPSFLTASRSQGDYLRSPPARIQRPGRAPVRGWRWDALCLELGARRDDALRRISPERDQKLAGEGDDGNAADPAAPLANACAEPGAQLGAGLMAEPEPSEFNHSMAQTAIAGFADTLLAIGAAALPGA